MTNTRLTREQINERLKKFNETNDWSVFDDVPREQHVDVMYPHSFNFSILSKEKEQ